MLEILSKALEKLKEEHEYFKPMLERELVARVYHHIMVANPKLVNEIRVEPRLTKKITDHVKGDKEVSTYTVDLVFGEEDTNVTTRFIKPKALTEFTVFVQDFTEQSRHKHLNKLLTKDLVKLGQVLEVWDCEQIVCLYDPGYWLFDGPTKRVVQLHKILRKRNEINPKIKIVITTGKEVFTY